MFCGRFYLYSVENCEDKTQIRVESSWQRIVMAQMDWCIQYLWTPAMLRLRFYRKQVKQRTILSKNLLLRGWQT